MIEDLLKYGNELEINGVVLQNGEKGVIVFFPNTSILKLYDHIQPSHEDMKAILNQLDTLGVEDLQKVVLRKSQRQIDSEVSWKVFRRDGYRCCYCGRNDVSLTVDHIVLWEHMGASEELNLSSACRKCNKTRGSMLYPEWLKSSYYLKVIKEFDNRKYSPAIKNPGEVASQQAHERNVAAWNIAQTVPLRNTKRSR